jgi:hypothetical protein
MPSRRLVFPLLAPRLKAARLTKFMDAGQQPDPHSDIKAVTAA